MHVTVLKGKLVTNVIIETYSINLSGAKLSERVFNKPPPAI